MWLFLKAWAMRKFATQYTEMCKECRELSQEELDLNLNFVYNVCDTWDTWYIHVRIIH